MRLAIGGEKCFFGDKKRKTLSFGKTSFFVFFLETIFLKTTFLEFTKYKEVEKMVAGKYFSINKQGIKVIYNAR